MEHGVPAHELTDAELERQGVHAHATRHWVFLHGTAEQFRTHTHRMLELEQEYLRRHPQRTWQGSGPEGASAPGDWAADTAPPKADSAAVATRIRDLVHTFVREIDYLLGAEEDEADAPPGPAELALLARVSAGPDGRLHKLEVHQIAREVGSTPRSVAALYKADPPLLRADSDHRAITEAGLAWLDEHPPAAPRPAPPAPSPPGDHDDLDAENRAERANRTTHRHDRPESGRAAR